VKQDEFEKLVSKALLTLPKKIRQKMKNIAICVEKGPSEEQLRKTGLRHGGFLLGLYEGIPQTVWGKGFGGNLPDKITIFQESIENFATRPEEAKRTLFSSSPARAAAKGGEERMFFDSPATQESVIKEVIKNVVWHEIAHHFGFSERGVKLLEQKRGT